MAYTGILPLGGVVDLNTIDNAGSGPFGLAGGLTTMGRQSYYFQKVNGVDNNLGGGEFVYAKNSAANVAGQSITSITTAAGTSVATVTTGSAHGLQVGSQVIFAGQVPVNYIGTFVVASIPSATTFTYNHGNASLGATTTQGTYTYGAIIPGALVTFTDAISAGVNTRSVVSAASTGNTGATLGVALIGLLQNQYGWFQVGGLAIANTAGTPAIGNPVYLGTAGAVTPTVAAGKQVINAAYASAVSAVIGSGSAAITLSSTQALIALNNAAVQTQIT